MTGTIIFFVVVAIIILILKKEQKQTTNYRRSKYSKPKKQAIDWKKRYADNKAKGEEYEIYVAEVYRQKGYVVEQRGINEGRKDGGVDIIATKWNEAILIQCKNWTGSVKITHKEAKEFFANCEIYIDKNNFDKEKTKCRLAIPAKESMHISAETFFKKNSPKYRYEIIPIT